MEELEIDPQSTNPEPEQEAGHEPELNSVPAGPQSTLSIEEWMASTQAEVKEAPPAMETIEDAQLLAVLEACVYVAEEPLMPAQIAAALNQDVDRVRGLLNQLVVEFERPEHGISIKEVAGGYKMATKAEHHDAVRNFVKSLKAPLKLSLPALETLAVIAYKQPVTTPEIMEIRGVQGGSVLRTLLDRKLITEAGRKNVIGKPILYKTTKEFLIQFGLKDLAELPSLKEFEEIRRMAMSEGETPAEAAETAASVEEPAASDAGAAGEKAETAAAAGEESGTAAPVETGESVEEPAAPDSEPAGRKAETASSSPEESVATAPVETGESVEAPADADSEPAGEKAEAASAPPRNSSEASPGDPSDPIDSIEEVPAGTDPGVAAEKAETGRESTLPEHPTAPESELAMAESNPVAQPEATTTDNPNPKPAESQDH